MLAKCDGCGNRTDHKHLHDEAHGISGTHMSGSERFVCKLCGHHTFAKDGDRNPDFKFLFDKENA